MRLIYNLLLRVLNNLVLIYFKYIFVITLSTSRDNKRESEKITWKSLISTNVIRIRVVYNKGSFGYNYLILSLYLFLFFNS